MKKNRFLFPSAGTDPDYLFQRRDFHGEHVDIYNEDGLKLLEHSVPFTQGDSFPVMSCMGLYGIIRSRGIH